MMQSTEILDKEKYTHQKLCSPGAETQSIIAENIWFQNLLLSNNIKDESYTANWLHEIKHFSKFLGSMIVAFPVGLIKRKQLRKNKQLSFILQFPELIPVRNNIEKGSFAYDTLLFKQSGFQLLLNKSHLANLVCLAILFGDEFIDGLAFECGKKNIRKILQDESINCNLQYRTVDTHFELFYAFDIRKVLPGNTLNTINEKYKITYNQFYDHLLFLLNEMNVYLTRLTQSIREQAAQLICKICNNCFDTYRMDIAKFHPEYSLQDLMNYFNKKDDDIIHSLLELRAVLWNKNTKEYFAQFNSWSTIVRSMQVYDDMEDAAEDLNYQMNFLCYFAKHFFDKEWQWLQQESESLKGLPALQRNFMVSMFMPNAVIACKAYAKNIVFQNLNWVQKKIAGYLWKKNWLGWNHKKKMRGVDVFSSFAMYPCNSYEKVVLIYNTVFEHKSTFISDTEKHAHVLDIALFDPMLKNQLLKFLPKKEAYFLSHHFFDYPANKKAAFAQKWMAHLQQECAEYILENASQFIVV